MVNAEFFENYCRHCPAVRLPLYASVRSNLTRVDTLPLLDLMLSMEVIEKLGLMNFHPPCQKGYWTEVVFSSDPIFQAIARRENTIDFDYLLDARIKLSGGGVCAAGLVDRTSRKIRNVIYDMQRLLPG